MKIDGKADSLELFNLKSRHTRVFHLSWFAFFACFFAWFGIAPLMPVIRDEFSLTKDQIGNIMIASVSATVFMRILMGWLCDRIGPRITYSALLVGGSVPVMCIGLSYDYHSFLFFRLLIGAIGGSFVITQYHTSVFYSARCVGTANATSAGWGNLGGGVTQMVMPLVFSLVVAAGVSEFWGWRISMLVVGVFCAVLGAVYYFFTTDTPLGNFKELRALGKIPEKSSASGGFIKAVKDKRVWILFCVYGACFGIELTMNNIAALYFRDYFELGLQEAGIVAGLFGVMNLFARSLGGFVGDRAGSRYGLQGRVVWLGAALLLEGAALIVFSRMVALPAALVCLIFFSLFVQMAEGATFSVVPFVNPGAVGSVAGIVGAGGNAGAVIAGFLFKGGMAWPDALMVLGALALGVGAMSFLLRFPDHAQEPKMMPELGASWLKGG
ncbi:MAG: MFS transporter [Deltaproteobacteria bacterium]|nr:MFS transporter [Deltaproteobacteria bacterium]